MRDHFTIRAYIGWRGSIAVAILFVLVGATPAYAFDRENQRRPLLHENGNRVRVASLGVRMGERLGAVRERVTHKLRAMVAAAGSRRKKRAGLARTALALLLPVSAIAVHAADANLSWTTYKPGENEVILGNLVLWDLSCIHNDMGVSDPPPPTETPHYRSNRFVPAGTNTLRLTGLDDTYPTHFARAVLLANLDTGVTGLSPYSVGCTVLDPNR